MRIERRAGEALRELVDVERLSVRETLEACGGRIDEREGAAAASDRADRREAAGGGGVGGAEPRDGLGVGLGVGLR